MINYDVPVNSRGLNANLRPNVFDDKTMKANGFFICRNCWSLTENLGHNVSLCISVSEHYIDIYAIDEDFCQPYDYQAILRNSPDAKVALNIHSRVQATMKRLSDAGIIEGWVANDYI